MIGLTPAEAAKLPESPMQASITTAISCKQVDAGNKGSE